MFNKSKFLLILFFCSVVTCCKAKDGLSEAGKELQTKTEWKFSGHLGNYIDTIAKSRILDRSKWNIVYPETENAFRLRTDDAANNGTGLWSGEFWGKYMLSVIAAERYYHSDELRLRIEEAVKGLLSTQEADGYIGTYRKSSFVNGNNWNVWCRKYTLWALTEASDLLGDDKILEAAERFTDQLIMEVGPGAADITRTGNFYGMPSSSILYPVVKLYEKTGKKKYLDYSEYIVNQWSRNPDGTPGILNNSLAGKPVQNWFPDPYSWAKGYEMISCVEGLAELYRVTGNDKYLSAALTFHRLLQNYERTPIGSLSFNDKFIGSAGIINTVSEVCDAVYWNRLSYELFQITGDIKYIDEIERTLFNSLLASFNTEGTWGLRRLRMSHQHIPAHNHFLMNHQCCTDNLPRGLFQAANTALCSRDGVVYLTLFNEGEGTIIMPSGNKVHIAIAGDYLETSSVKIIIKSGSPEKFTLKVRVPFWSAKTVVYINNDKPRMPDTDSWLTINRSWGCNDEIDMVFTMKVRMEFFNPAALDTSNYSIGFLDKTWASMAFIKGTNDSINKKYEVSGKLQIKDALPCKRAVTFFYGPLALSRDIRLTGPDVFFAISDPEKKDLSIKTVSSPSGIWKAFDVSLGHGKNVRFCDFSSAGNTWNKSSVFNTWCIIEP